ncbi:MAG: hypothetical protein KC900_11825 [Candidatus Omnitrophica bacterium]|nr:hypothetical protein [Candidatus Omnitrophota bacterium]
MNENNDGENRKSKNNPHHSPTNSPHKLRITDSIAVYTQLSILLRMRRELGLEAMLQYLEAYVQIVQRANPELKQAVDQALSMMSTKRIYRQAFPE